MDYLELDLVLELDHLDFELDLELELDLKAPGSSDDLRDTVDYSRVYRAVKETVEGPSRNLLESLAEGVAQELLRTFPLDGVRVRVIKPHVPIEGAVLEGAGVEIDAVEAEVAGAFDELF